MLFHPTALEGAYVVEPEPHYDARGFFARTFCVAEFKAKGLQTVFVQHSVSKTLLKGSLRGMHFQREPHEEVKVVTCTRGAIHDVIVDLRPASSTYLKWQAFELTADNAKRLYIPAGLAHGFQTMADNAEVTYLISAFYAPAFASGVRYNDPTFGIEWPRPVTTLSNKDRDWPDYQMA